jgi:hypothetical protein
MFRLFWFLTEVNCLNGMELLLSGMWLTDYFLSHISANISSYYTWHKNEAWSIFFSAQYKEMGYLPQAMVNYLALLGWGDGTEN